MSTFKSSSYLAKISSYISTGSTFQKMLSGKCNCRGDISGAKVAVAFCRDDISARLFEL